MVGLLIAASIFAHQIEAIAVKRYGDKKGKGGMFFNSFLCLFAVIYFVVSAFNMSASSFLFSQLFKNIVIVMILLFQPAIESDHH